MSLAYGLFLAASYLADADAFCIPNHSQHAPAVFYSTISSIMAGEQPGRLTQLMLLIGGVLNLFATPLYLKSSVPGYQGCLGSCILGASFLVQSTGAILVGLIHA